MHQKRLRKLDIVEVKR